MPVTLPAAKACFTVMGTPAPKGSRTVGRRRDGTVYTRPAAAGEKAWTRAVADTAMWWAAQRLPRPVAPYRVHVAFYLPRPGRPAHPWPSRGDIDKLCRATLDGLIGHVILDDSHVVELSACKRWAETADGACAQVTVTQAE